MNDGGLVKADEGGDLATQNTDEEVDLEGLSTLDEPVSETIKRDLLRIYSKLRIVVNPLQLGIGNQPNNMEEKRKEVRNWDLWGPFIFTLVLSVVLSSGTQADDKTLLFELVFVIVWLGGAVIALNGQLLGGTISFF